MFRILKDENDDQCSLPTWNMVTFNTETCRVNPLSALRCRNMNGVCSWRLLPLRLCHNTTSLSSRCVVIVSVTYISIILMLFFFCQNQNNFDSERQIITSINGCESGVIQDASVCVIFSTYCESKRPVDVTHSRPHCSASPPPSCFLIRFKLSGLGLDSKNLFCSMATLII